MKKRFVGSSFALLLGLIFILGSVLMEQNLTDCIKSNIADSGFIESLVLIVSKILSAVGIALVVSFIMKRFNAFDEENKLSYIKNVITDTVITKPFISTLNRDGKKQLITTMLAVNNDALQNTANIAKYLDKRSDGFLEFFNRNFRSDFIIHIDVYKDIEKAKYFAKFKMSYRIYKINNKYCPVKISLEKPTDVIDTVVKYNGEELKKLNRDDLTQCAKSPCDYFFEIPDTYCDHDFLEIERVIEEQGHQHWISINWTSLTPIDGINFSVQCHDGLVKEYNIFDQKSLYSIDMSNDRKQIMVKSAQWLDPYTGLCVIIADASNDDDFK